MKTIAGLLVTNGKFFFVPSTKSTFVFAVRTDAVHHLGTFNDLGYSGTQQGFYVQGIYQFMPQWRVGYRYDWLSAGIRTQSTKNRAAQNHVGGVPTRSGYRIFTCTRVICT